VTPGDLTVISWANDAYRPLFHGLRQDCERLGYPCHLYRIEDEYPSLVKAWCNHPRIIRKGVEDFGTVLFLDVECRILAPIPPHWRAPLVSVRHPAQKFWIRYNTGTVIADRSCVPWLDAWIDIIDDWEMGDLAPDDYVHWPGDLCDELALAAALAALRVKVHTPALEYVDRSSDAELARGLWRGPQTIVQHPTIHHWPREHEPIECKKLLVQNYPHDPAAVEAIFEQGTEQVQINGWVFDAAQRLFAPVEHWPANSRRWIDEPVAITAAQR
jgi:hypothetical protein